MGSLAFYARMVARPRWQAETPDGSPTSAWRGCSGRRTRRKVAAILPEGGEPPDSQYALLMAASIPRSH